MIVEIRPGQRFDPRQRVAFGVAAVTDRTVERDRNRDLRARIIRRVVASAADQLVSAVTTQQDIVAAAAGQDVIARPAAQNIVGRIAGQNVVALRPDQVFDAGQRIALGIATTALPGRQVDRHALRAVRIVRRVDTSATVERIRARAADQHVVARAARQGVVAAIADQQVVKVAAQHALDVDEHVARGAAGRDAAIKIDVHPAVGVRIVRGVETFATVEQVGTQSADQGVIARTAAQHIVADAAGQRIGKCRTVDFLDPRQRIALGIAAPADGTVKAHRHAGAGGRIIRDVTSLAAVQHVGTGTAYKGVIAPTARQMVGKGVAGQHVAEHRTGQIFDIAQRIALGVAAMANAAVQAHLNRRARAAIVRGIVTFAAVEHVGTAMARQHVVARAAQQAVGIVVAHQSVVESGTRQPLDRNIGVARRVARQRRSVECCMHPRGRPGIARNVEPFAAVEHVRARAALKNVVALSTGQRVVARIADQMVGEGAAGQILDIGIGVALGVAAMADAPVEEHFDRNLAVGEADAVDARATVDMVGTLAAGQRVVAVVAIEIVVMVGADQIFDAGQRIALGIAARPRRAVEMGSHPGRRARIARGIGSLATVQLVSARAADEQIVARAAVQRFISTGAIDGVVAIRADDMFDIDERVAFGPAAVAGGAVEVDFDTLGRIFGRRLFIGKGIGIGDGIEPRTAVDLVRARAAVDHVVAVAASQRIVMGGTDDILDTRIGVALGIAALARARLQIDGDGIARHFIADGIGAATAVDLVRTGTRDHNVIAVPGIDDVARRVREENVDRRTRHRVGRLHVGVRGNDLDPEMRRDFDRIGIVGTVGRQAKIDGQEEFALEPVGRGFLAVGGQGVGQRDIETEMGFGRGIGDDRARRIGAARLDLDIALIDIDDPALVGQLGVLDRESLGQGRDQDLEQLQIGRRHHRADVQHAGAGARGCVGRAVDADHVVAAGSGNRLPRGLRGIGGVLR